MDPIVSKIASAAITGAGIAASEIITDAIKEGVSDLCGFDLDDF